MNKAKALDLMNSQFKNFKYIYKKELLKIDLWHFTFNMDLGLPKIQMTLEFSEKYLDILAFPHPVIVNDENFGGLFRIINYINWNIKGIGRFYIDDNKDIAYSLRIKYEMLEKMPKLSLQEIEFAIDLYSDILKILFDISNNKMSYEDGKKEIDFMWNGVYCE